MSTIVEMIVHMDCPGCESKIRKALQRLDGVDNIDIDMGMQKVTVTGCADQEKVLKTVRKNGRQAELWPFPYNPEYQNFNQYYNYDQYQHQSDPTTYFTSDHSISSYNYYEHDYNGHELGYYQPPYSTILDQQASALFSDENSSACSIM